MVKYACAAKQLCISSHVRGIPAFTCKECCEPMHEHCTGLSCQRSDGFFDAHGGRTCALCANKLVLNFLSSPDGRKLHNSRLSGGSPLSPLPIQQSQQSPESPAATPACMLGDIPVYATNGKFIVIFILILLLIYTSKTNEYKSYL